MSQRNVWLALVLVLLVLPLVAAEGELTVPSEASIDSPIEVGIAPQWIGHASVRIDDGAAFYRASVDEGILRFTPRRAGVHGFTLVDTQTGAEIAQATLLVTVPEPPQEIPPEPSEEIAPREQPVFEPVPEEQQEASVVDEPQEVPAVEPPAPMPVAEPPKPPRPTVPQLTWDARPWTRATVDQGARTRAQAALPRLTVDDVRRDARGRYDLRLRAAGQNSLEAHGAADLPAADAIGFLPPDGTSTDIVRVDNLSVENATVRLAKDSQVDAIARCDAFLPDGSCERWVESGIPFTDLGTHVEFTVTHFSGYAGVHNATYFFVENTTFMRANTANRIHANLTFSDPSGSQWLIVAYNNHVMNNTAIQGRVYLTRGTVTVAEMQKRVTETAEANTFFYITNYTGDGGTVTFLINASTSGAAGNITMRQTRLMALRLDDSPSAQYNGTHTGTLTSNVDSTFADDAGDALNVSLDVRDAGLYLVYGGATYNSDNTSASARMRLVMNGTVIKPDTYLEEEDANVAETHIGSMARVVSLGTGFHTFALQVASESTATTDWQYATVGAVRLTDAYTFWYGNESGSASTTSTTTPANAANSTNDTYSSHNYTIIASGLMSASATARRTDARTYVNNVIRGNSTIRPQDTTDYVAAGMVDHVTGATSLTANLTVLTNNAGSTAAMKYADLLIIEVGNYSAPINIQDVRINRTGPVSNNTIIRVNASVTNISLLTTVRLQVDSPLRAPFNATMTQSGSEWFNSTITLNETGIWTFTVFANDTPGYSPYVVATDAEGTPYIEVNASPTIDDVHIDPDPAYSYSPLIGYCTASAGADRPLAYNYTWFINGTPVLNGTSWWEGISVGDNHACGLYSKDRRVVCWGYNANGQLGNNDTGTNTNTSTFTNDTTAYVMVSAGAAHTCGIRANDSRVLCWGSNTNGRLGNDEPGVARNIPVLTGDSSAYLTVSAGTLHTCGIRASDGRVLCWGSNNNGQQGNNASGISNSVPNATNDSSAYVAVSAGGAHTCGIRANDGRVLCWGSNSNGQLGNNDTGTNRNISTLTNDSSAYLFISAGGSHTCGIRANDSRVLCWGSNSNGQLGNNDTGTDLNVPTLTNDSSAYKTVSTSGVTTCGIRANDSRVLCWGYNGNGQLGNNDTGTDLNVPTIANGTSAYTTVKVGSALTCGIRANDGRVLCWGFNGQGQLGMNHTVDLNVPTLTNDTKPFHGGATDGQEVQIALLTPRYLVGFNITLQCQAYDGQMWTAPVNTSMLVQDSGPPVIDNVSTIGAVTPLAAQNVTVRVNFTAHDVDGVDGLVDTAANFTLRNGSVQRQGSCSPTDLNTTSVRYNCSLSLTHYDTPGKWVVNVSIRDLGLNNVSNASTNTTVNNLLALDISTTYSFGSVAPGGAPGAGTGNPFMVDNQGNVNLSWLNITAYTLVNGTSTIQTSNITVNTTNNLGTPLVNGTPLNLTNTTTIPDTDAGESNRSLFFYISVPNATRSLTYVPILPWEVTTQ